MTLNKVFRLSTYLSLAFSTAALGYAERLHLPNEAMGFYPALIVTFFIAFVVEDRWAMPKATANLVGVGVILLCGAWLAYSWRALPTDELDFDVIRWALPRMGPVMGVLMLAKLFRPKLPSDYWLLHMLALIQIALACVMDRDMTFGLLLLGYIIVTAWSLMLFHLHRESAAFCTETPSVRGQARGAPRAALSPWRLLGLRQMGGWALLGLVCGLMLFLFVPRPGQGGVGALFIPAGARSQTGFSPEMNLNNTGLIEGNNEVVMRVEAYDSRGDLVHLDPEQRWRGITCSHYDAGRWTPAGDPLVGLDTRGYPNRLREDEVEFLFEISIAQVRNVSQIPELRGRIPLFLAEPLRQTPNTYFPLVRPVQPSGIRLQFWRNELAVLRETRQTNQWWKYSQIGLRTGRNVGRPDGVYPTYQSIQLGANDRFLQGRERIREKAEEILKTPKAAAILKTAQTPQELMAAKAKALEQHLVSSGEYQYTLDRRREDTSTDPTVDFLCNVKQGHCELYASALALMLRSQRIPARVVIGFRGADWSELEKAYWVRQSHAHAWVEAFVPAEQGSTVGHWLTLDGVPIFDATPLTSPEKRSFWNEGLELARYAWEYFILDYNADAQRAQLVARLESMGVLPSGVSWSGGGALMLLGAVLAAVGVALGAMLLVRWWRRRGGGAGPAGIRRRVIAFYARLLRLLSRVALRPKPAQTPRELGAQAGNFLRKTPATGPVADVPAEVAEAFYEVRFGGRDLEPDQLANIEQQLDRLDQALER